MTECCHIDIESFSEAPLRKTGLYRYSQDPSTEILCTCFAFGEGDVWLWLPYYEWELPDLIINTLNYEMPGRWIAHRECPSVLVAWAAAGKQFRAHNASFERTLLNGHAGQRIRFPRTEINQWVCTAAKAASHGMPRALGDCAKALGSYPKNESGKSEMYQLTKPRKNCKEGRYLPDTAPQKFINMYLYCADDVLAERDVDKIIPDMSPDEQMIWEVDQKINERGLRVDLPRVKDVWFLIEEYKKEIEKEFLEITSVRPSQTQVFAEWVRARMPAGLYLDNLQAATVEALVKVEGLPKNVKRALILRSIHASKASAKYPAILRAVMTDDRIRGMFLFCGASTGRWCLTGDHEVLTPSGWQRLDVWRGGRLMCWSENGKADFEHASANSFAYTGDLLVWKGERFSQLATPEHRMPVVGHAGGLPVSAIDTKMRIPRTGVVPCSSRYSEQQLRFLIMAQADGHCKEGVWKFAFTKSRKEARCRALLNWLGLVYNYNVYENEVKPRHVFTVHASLNPQHTWMWDMGPDKLFPMELLYCDHRVFFEELELWDGYRCGPNSVQYGTVCKWNADFIQAKAHVSGLQCNIVVKERTKVGEENWSTAYYCNIWLSNAPTAAKAYKKSEQRVPYTGEVYCPTTPTGFFLVRRDGRCWITGNSSMIVQLQNLFRGAIKDPDNAIAAYRTRSLDWIRALYSPLELMKVFASTVRGMLIPAEGHDFIALDYAGIESRVIAWIYGETWKLKAFHIQDTEGGPDNYEYAYANTFKVPVESVNADQRQIGKPIDLGLGFQGGVGAFTTMAKTYKVDLNLLADMAFNKLEPHFLDKARWNFEKGYTSGHDLPEKVVLACDAIKHAWREAHPKIVQGWSDTDTAARAAVASPGEVFGISNKKLMFKVVGRWLYMRLPSGRKLAYYMPRLEQDGSVTFMGLDTDTRRWQRCKTYGGFWVQNSTQAIANDLLRAAILRWEAASYWVVGSVHDEGIMEVPEGWGSIEEAKQIMCDSPAWAKGLPVVAEGWRAKRYKK